MIRWTDSSGTSPICLESPIIILCQVFILRMTQIWMMVFQTSTISWTRSEYSFHHAPPRPCRLVPLLKSSHIMRDTYLKNLPHESGSWYTVDNCFLLGDKSCTPGSSHGDHCQEGVKARHGISCKDFPIPSHHWHCLW